MWVKDLLNVNRTDWDEGKVRELIHEDDVNAVLALKFYSEADDDLLRWHYTKSGLHTVKSAYWVSTHTTEQNAQPPPGNISLKTAVWKLPISPKIKHFLWRFLSGALPTGEQLKRRHISQQSRCRRCCTEEETTDHLFFCCDYAQATWRASGFPCLTLFDPLITVEDKLQTILTFCARKEVDGIMIHLPFWILWRLWKTRNLLTFEQRNIHWRSCMIQAKKDTKEWTEAMVFNETLSEPFNRPARQTSPCIQDTSVNPGWIKCNYDGSFWNSETRSGAGWIFRDSRGSYIQSGQANANITNSPLESELQAMVLAMQHASDIGIKRIHMVGDNKEIVNTLNKKRFNFAAFNWIREARKWSKNFDMITYNWIPRRNNRSADILAKKGISENILLNYYRHVPDFLQSSLHCEHLQS